MFCYTLPIAPTVPHSWQDLISKDEQTHGSMVVSLLLGSDKTTVSVATGQNDYYPLYLSIGNITNRVRRAHEDGVVVIGFLAIPKCTFSSATVLLATPSH